MLRAILAAAAALPLYFSPCDGPTSPGKVYEGPLSTPIGLFQVVVPVELEPALREGLETCAAWVARDLRWSPGRVAGALDGWRAVVHGRGSEILFGARKLLVDASGPPGTRNGALHECYTAAAWALGTCDRYHLIGLCGDWGPGVTVACEPC